MMTNEIRVELAKELDVDVKDVIVDKSQFNYHDKGIVFDTPDGEVLVCTEDQADEKAKQYILNSLWAFDTNFIQKHSEALNKMKVKDLKDIQSKLCENANPMIKACIDDLDRFVEDAIDTDGRGHFVNNYDGVEYELDLDDEYLVYYLVG